jgi:quinol monooxygenase YgiN
MLGGLDIQAWARVPCAPRTRGICAILRAQVKAGFADQFEALLNDFAFTVLAEERGCASYVATRQLGADNHFAVHARFIGWHSFQRHALTAHMKRALPRLNALLATPVSLEIFVET